MSQSDARSVIWITILLAAVRHKARDQSTASYLLDLQSRFPVTTKHDEGPDWRTYALELEKQLAVLKAQRDADQELLSKIRTDASQVASTSDPPPPRKKSKKNSAKDQHDPEWSWDQSRADWSRFLSTQYPSPPSLIAAYTSLKGALVAPNTDFHSYASRVTDAILRALNATHFFLFSPPNPSPDAHTQTSLGAPLQLQPEHIDSVRIALVSPFLIYILRTALHTLVRTAQDSTKSKRPRQRPHTTTSATPDAHAHIDMALDRLLECVLLPLLRAIAPLCSARLAPFVSPSLRKDKDKGRKAVGKGKDRDKSKDNRVRTSTTSTDPPNETDVRTDVFALIGASLEALDALPPLAPPSSRCPNGGGGGNIAGEIRDRLGLETIRELEALYAVPPPPHPPLAPPPTSLQPPSQQSSSATQPEPPPLSTPAPTPISTPPSAPSQPQPQPQSQPQLQRGTQRRPVPESRMKRLERLAGTRAERIRALATRDAGWLLASTLSLCVTPTPAPVLAASVAHGQDGRTEPSGNLLREALLDRIGKLVRSVGVVGSPIPGSTRAGEHSTNSSDTLDDRANATVFKSAIDPVCQNMLLAICERAIGHLMSS